MLTDRESEILRLLEHGHCNAQIGGKLSISPLTSVLGGAVWPVESCRLK